MTGDGKSSSRPFGFTRHKFLGRNISGGFGELRISARLAGDLGGQLGRNAVQTGRRDFLQVAGLNLLFQAFKLLPERLPTQVTLTENALGEPFGFGGTQVLDLELVLAAPLDPCGLGELQLHRDAVEASTLWTHHDKAGTGFLVIHRAYVFLVVRSHHHGENVDAGKTLARGFRNYFWW